MSLCSPPLIAGVLCVHYNHACLYSSVLSLLRKPVNMRLRSRTVSGNECYFMLTMCQILQPLTSLRPLSALLDLVTLTMVLYYKSVV